MEQPRVLVAITSYNRKKSLFSLVGELLQYENTDVVIFDDKACKHWEQSEDYSFENPNEDEDE